jgi:hypothetical protein
MQTYTLVVDVAILAVAVVLIVRFQRRQYRLLLAIIRNLEQRVDRIEGDRRRV